MADPKGRGHWRSIVLGVDALALGAVGLFATTAPHAFAGLTGITLPTPAAVADFRAVYGGLHLAIAAVLVAAIITRRTTEGLFVALSVMAGLALVRTWSMATTQATDELTLWLLAPEVVGLLVNGWALWRRET